MLFDLRSRGRRRTVQVVYLGLAILFGGGLILFGVGTGSGGGLLNAFTGNGSSSSQNSAVTAAGEGSAETDQGPSEQPGRLGRADQRALGERQHQQPADDHRLPLQRQGQAGAGRHHRGLAALHRADQQAQPGHRDPRRPRLRLPIATTPTPPTPGRPRPRPAPTRPRATSASRSPPTPPSRPARAISPRPRPSRSCPRPPASRSPPSSTPPRPRPAPPRTAEHHPRTAGKITLVGPLAQLVEQGTLNPKVGGSIPPRPIPKAPPRRGFRRTAVASGRALSSSDAQYCSVGVRSATSGGWSRG